MPRLNRARPARGPVQPQPLRCQRDGAHPRPRSRLACHRLRHHRLDAGDAALRRAAARIRTSGEAFPPRLRQIFDGVVELMREYRPTEVAIERVFMHRNADSALKLGQARGAALCAAFASHPAVFEYAPREVKLAVVGHGWRAERPGTADGDDAAAARRRARRRTPPMRSASRCAMRILALSARMRWRRGQRDRG